MFRDKSKPKQIKLDKQSGVPTVKMLEEIRQKSMATGSTVELPFGDDMQTLILTVCREFSKGTWVWMLYRDDGFSSGLEWSHGTHDCNYIHTLVTNSSPGFVITKTGGGLPLKPATDYDSHDSTKLRKGTLEGSLKNIQIANLLQSMSMGQMTGRLEIVSSNDTAKLFFTAGKPIHAALRGAEGNEAMIQLFGWEEGEFSFYDEQVNVPTTVTRSLTGLMMEGAAFVNHLNFLTKAGLSYEAYLVRVKDVPNDELVSLLRGGVDCNLELQINIYESTKNNHRWAELSSGLTARKTEWVPVLFNLANCGLIRFEKEPSRLSAPSVRNQIDWTVVQAIEHGMRRSDTGLYTHAALLWSLQQEFYRFEGMELPFSLVLFGYCLKSEPANPDYPPSFIPFRTRAIVDLRDKLSRTKRKFDHLCHHGAFGYALLLPMTARETANRVADIVAETCASIAITDEHPLNQIEFRAGIANIPEDCTTLDELMALAQKAHPLS